MFKLISKSSGIELAKHSLPNISDNDVLVETIASCYSKGTESSTIKNHQKSIVSKIIGNKSKILELFSKGDFSQLLAKLNNQKLSVINLGYSASGRVLSKGKNVHDINIGDTVVVLGSSANHSQFSIVPQGLCISIGDKVDPLDASAAAIASIALNSVQLANPMIGSKALVIGCGLLGQFVTQFLSLSGISSTCVDIEDWKFAQAKEHGAESCLTLNEFINESISNKFDSIFIATPSIDIATWRSIGQSSKFSAKILMLGAADLNCPREIFYKKHLNFISPHSYGPGRGIYDFEIMNQDFPEIASTWDIRSNVRTFIKLLLSKKITTKFIDTFVMDESSDDSLINALEDNKAYSVILDWRKLENKTENNEAMTFKKVDDISPVYKNICIYGYSDFAKEAHIPSISNQNNLELAGVFNRSPIKEGQVDIVDAKKLSSNSIGTIVISSNHGTHATILLEMINLNKFTIVDKPLCINSDQLNQIIDAREVYNANYVCFMSRRYSEHTLHLEKYINNRTGPFHLDLNFQVPRKDVNDPIYKEGGRLVGEMCHHVDLAIFLLGKPLKISYADTDESSPISLRENASILLTFKNGSTAYIRYSSIGNLEGVKEKIKLSFDSEVLEITDFMKTVHISKKNKEVLMNKFDKGFEGMWKHLSRIISSEELDCIKIKEMSDIDILVTKILLREKI